MPFIEPGKLLMAASLVANERWRLAELVDPEPPEEESE
jgi:hypothetical protein